MRYKREIFILGVLEFLKTTRSFPKIPEKVRSLPKKSEVYPRHLKSAEVCRRRARSQCFSLQISEIARKVLSLIHFTHSLHIFGNCVKQDGNNSNFSIRREKLARKREPAWDQSFQPAGVRVGRYAQGGRVMKSVRLWGWAVGFKTVGGSTINNCGTIEKNNSFYFRYRITLHTAYC